MQVAAQPAYMAKKCATCGADAGEPCREMTAAPIIIRKSKVKQKRDMVSKMPIRREPHASRITA